MMDGQKLMVNEVGQDSYQTYAYQGLAQLFFVPFVALNTGAKSRHSSEIERESALFVSRESQVARNSGDCPFDEE